MSTSFVTLIPNHLHKEVRVGTWPPSGDTWKIQPHLFTQSAGGYSFKMTYNEVLT